MIESKDAATTTATTFSDDDGIVGKPPTLIKCVNFFLLSKNSKIIPRIFCHVVGGSTGPRCSLLQFD